MADESSKIKQLHAGHRQRMKRRMLKNGLESFEPHEMMEILLYYTNPRRDTNELGHLLIDTFGSVRDVMDADFDELCAVKGISESTASHIIFIRELIRIYLMRSAGEVLLDSPVALCKYCSAAFLGKKVEQIRLLSLNHELGLVSDDLVSEGEIGSVQVNIRKMLEIVIKNKCDIVVVTHNHPKGSDMPSKSDIQSTRRIFNALANINVQLADHIIVGMNGETSLRAAGMIPDIWS